MWKVVAMLGPIRVQACFERLVFLVSSILRFNFSQVQDFMASITLGHRVLMPSRQTVAVIKSSAIERRHLRRHLRGSPHDETDYRPASTIRPRIQPHPRMQ